MPTSSYMPDVKVQIAWNGGFRVPMSSWTWTDVSAYVELGEGISGSWGRQDERSTADANTLTLTLDNSDGRFTAARATSPYYPNVVLYKPIRVLADPVDGAELPLFTGYITSWPLEWEDTDAYAKVTVTAASRLARLGLNAQWRSLVEETFLADDPVAYYPLGEAEGSTTAADVSGVGTAPLTMIGDPTLPVVFGQATGPGTDDLTAATFTPLGQYLWTSVTPIAASFSVEGFFNATARADLVRLRQADGTVSVAVALEASGVLSAAYNSVTVATVATYLDGNTHHFVVTFNGTTLVLYVDGVSAGSAAVADGHSGLTELLLASSTEASLVLAHVAVYDAALSSTRVLAHATAGAGAWVGETTDARFGRYADMAGIPAAEVNAEAGSTTVVHVDTTGANVVDLLRTLEATEAGVMFDAPDGRLTLHNRGHRYTRASALTLDMSKQEVEADYSPRLDPSALANDITVTGVRVARLIDEPSIDANGVATASLTTASQDDDEPLNLASWALKQFKDPRPRVPSLSVNVTAHAVAYSAGKTTVTSAALLGVTVGDKVTVANHPQQAAVSISDYFVEGGSFTIGPESFDLTWNLSPSSPEDQVLIIDDPVRGVIDTNVIGL